MFQKVLVALAMVGMLSGCVMPAPSARDRNSAVEETATVDVADVEALQDAAETLSAVLTGTPAAAPQSGQETQPELDLEGFLAARETGRLLNPNYVVQNGTPLATGNLLDPEAGCNWMGVGGQVFGADQVPVTGVVAEVSGELAGSEVLLLSLTGTASNLGPGGYGITLNNEPVASNNTLYIQLYDAEGNPLSDRRSFDTYDDCERNQILINFIEVPGGVSHHAYLPLFLRGRSDAFLPLIQGIQGP